MEFSQGDGIHQNDEEKKERLLQTRGGGGAVGSTAGNLTKKKMKLSPT